MLSHEIRHLIFEVEWALESNPDMGADLKAAWEQKLEELKAQLTTINPENELPAF